MSVEVISIIGLLAVFLIATLLPVNMGALALGVAFAVGTALVHETPEEIIAGFPGDLFLILVGATLLFAIAKENGTIDWLVHKAVRMSGSSIAVIPWIMFGVTTLMTAFGALGPAAVAIVAPIALAFAARYKIQPVLMGLMVANGASAGGFAPAGVFGGMVTKVVERNSLPADPMTLFLGSLLFNIAICAVAFFMFGGRELIGKKGPATVGSTPEGEGSAGVAVASLNAQRILTLIGIVGVAVGVLYELDMGFLAISVAVILSLTAPYQTTNAVNKVAWSTVLLICGIVTYVELMERIGSIEYVGNGVATIGPPLISAILICFIAAVFSAFGSTTALLGMLIPLAVPFLLKGEVGVVGLIVALCISASVVDASPFSTSGALVVANSAGDSDRVFRQLRAWGFSMVAVAPVVSWLIFVVPGWL